MDIVYRLVVIASGLLLLIVNLIKIAQKKMDVGIGSSWTIMAMVVVIFGAFFDFTILLRKVTIRNTVLIFLFFAVLVIALYIYALRITELKKRNNEVAIWLSIIKARQDSPDGRNITIGVRKELDTDVDADEGATGSGIDA